MFGNVGTRPALPDWIEYHHDPKQEVIVELYNEASIWLQASVLEGFGLTALEAMACGAALVTTDCGGYTRLCIERHRGRDGLASAGRHRASALSPAGAPRDGCTALVQRSAVSAPLRLGALRRDPRWSALSLTYRVTTPCLALIIHGRSDSGRLGSRCHWRCRAGVVVESETGDQRSVVGVIAVGARSGTRSMTGRVS